MEGRGYYLRSRHRPAAYLRVEEEFPGMYVFVKHLEAGAQGQAMIVSLKTDPNQYFVIKVLNEHDMGNMELEIAVLTTINH